MDSILIGATKHFENEIPLHYNPIHTPTTEDTPENIDYCMDCPLTDCKYKSVERCKEAGRVEPKSRTTAGGRSGIKGVSWDTRTEKWTAYIVYQGKQHNLGLYGNIDEAAEVRRAAEKKYL